MKILFICIIYLLVWNVQSETFLFTKFSDSMQPEFLNRNNGVTLSNPDVPNTIYVGYGTPGNATETTLVMQKFSPFTYNSFPPQPLETLYTSPSKFGPPSSDFAMLAVLVGDEILLASKLSSGMGLTRWLPNSNASITRMDYSVADTSASWNSPEIQSNASFTSFSQVQLMSIAVADSASVDPLAAIAVNFDDVFRVFIYNISSAGTVLTGIVNSSPPPDKTVGAIALMPFNGGSEFMLAFAVQQSVAVWEGRLQVIDSDFNLRDYLTINSTNIRQIFDMQLHPSSINGYFFVTAQLANVTHTMIKRILVQEGSNTGVISEIGDVVALFSSNSFVSATNKLSSGEMVTVWINNNDLTNIYGHAKDYRPSKPDAFTFKIPAATATNKIGSLIVTPLSDATFAITQVVRGSNPSTFVNYYVLSTCGDATITPNENCINGNDGCVNCMCSEVTGWHSTGDGQTCITTCSDGIIAGNETCYNEPDANCVNCQCINGTEWQTEQRLCLVPVPVAPPVSGGNLTPNESTGPAASPSNPVPFDNKLIAAIICAPVAAGAAIFLGVFFGRRNAKKKKDKDSERDNKDDLPLKSLDSGKYSSVEAVSMTEVRTNDEKYGAINTAATTPQKSVDKMNVPYADLKFMKEIGSGAYGKVFIGEWQRTKVALKINTLASGDEFAREAKLMVDLRPHPNVVQMLGISSDGPYPVMILEFCDGGSLDTKLFQESQVTTLNEQLVMISGIAKGLYHLHKNQIVHRDMAARNILLNFNQPKISDFGLSRFVNDTQKGTTRSNVGPIRWMSPESLKNQIYSPKSDVWSFGMVLYEIVARKEPHAEADQMAIGLQIRDNGITPEIPSECDPCLAELMKKCWQLDPEQRPTMEEICDMIDNYMQEKNI